MEETYKTAFVLDDGTRVNSFQKEGFYTEFTDRDTIEQCFGWLLEKAFNVKVDYIEHYQDGDDSDGKETEKQDE